MNIKITIQKEDEIMDELLLVVLKDKTEMIYLNEKKVKNKALNKPINLEV